MHSRVFFKAIHALAGVLLLPPMTGYSQAGSAPSNATQVGTLDIPALCTLIQNRLATDPIPSISIAVVAKGQILWEEGFGWANREKQIPATAQTAYYLASVTKSITATALMMLQERRAIDLDQPVNRYLGSARVSSPRWKPAEATVRRIATHTAGIPTFDYRCFGDPERCSAPLDELINRYGILCRAPGEQFDYSNLDYGILGQAIAHVTGKSLAGFLAQEVFQPLGMAHASLGTAPDSEAYTALRYSYQHGPRPRVTSVALGASAGYGSVHDLALFSLFHLKTPLPSQKPILTPASIDVMQRQTVATGFTGQAQQYGLGWWIGENQLGYRSVMGQGGTDDASTLIHLVPSENVAVILLANMGTNALGPIANAALTMLLPPSPEKAPESVATQQTVSPTSTSWPTTLMGNWTGFIKTPAGNRFLRFSLDTTGTVQAVLGAEPLIQKKKATYNPVSKEVSLRTSGDLAVPADTGLEPYDLDFELRPYGNTLGGVVTTNPRGAKEKFARLSYWVELTRPATR